MELRNQYQNGNACEHICSLLPAYTDGTLDSEQSASVASHLKDCPECRAAATLLRDLPNALNDVLPLPDDALHAEIMAEVKKRPRRHLPVYRIAAGIAAVVCLFTAAVVWIQNDFILCESIMDNNPNSGSNYDGTSSDQCNSPSAEEPSINNDPEMSSSESTAPQDHPGDNETDAPGEQEQNSSASTIPSESDEMTDSTDPNATILYFSYDKNGRWISEDGNIILCFSDNSSQTVTMQTEGEIWHGTYDPAAETMTITQDNSTLFATYHISKTTMTVIFSP